MALTFDYKQIIDREGLDFIVWRSDLGKEYFTGEFDAMVWATMIIGGDELTEANLDKKLQRLTQLRLGEPSWDDLPKTRAQLARYIGLRTNAGVVTDAQWKKNLFDVVVTRAEKEIKAQEREAAKLAQSA